MKKILLSIVAILAVAMSANAEEKVKITKECNLSALPAASENTTWSWDADAKVGTFEWSQTSYNSTEVFGAGDYSQYETLNYVAEAGTADHFRIIVKFSDGTAQVTYNPAEVGEVSLTWSQLGVNSEKLNKITTIRISGANNAVGNVLFKRIYLEGVEGATKIVYKMPEGAVDLADLTGTNANWASTVVYPKEFKAQGLVFGDGDGSNEATHVDVSAYDKLAFYISNYCDGLSLRVWMWNGSGVTTLYPHPVADEATANFSEEYIIKEPGVYVLNFGGLKDLKGVKAANIYNGASLIVEKAFVMPSTVATPLEIMKEEVASGITAPAFQNAAVKAGKFMENGKLVIVKNGQKFNVAGTILK